MELPTNTPAAAPVDSAPTPEVIDASTPPQDGQVTPEPVKPPSRLQKRIDQLTFEKNEDRRAREAAEAKLADFQRQQQLHQQFSQLDSQAPQIDRFQSLHEYQMAMSNWTAQRAAMAATAQWEQRYAQEQAQRQAMTHQAMAQQVQVMRENAVIEEKLTAGTKKYPDLIQVVNNPELPPIRSNPVLLQALLSADNPADIAYYAAKNPAEYERLLSIRDPVQATREVMKLDAKFSGSGSTSAPPPPPNRNGTTTAPRDWSQMSTAEHVKAYAERNRKR